MGYILTEEQEFLKDSAKDLLKAAPVALVRELRDNNNPNGFSMDLWDKMVEMGWPATALSEESGGLGFGLRGAGILMEESGKTLSGSPLLSTLIVSKIIERYGNSMMKQILESCINDGKIVAIALQEGNFYSSKPKSTTISIANGKALLNGEKSMVVDGHVADYFLVTADSEEGTYTVLVNAKSEGVKIDKVQMMDARFYGVVSFNDLDISEDSTFNPNDSKNIIGDITNMANALLSAELIGIMSEAFHRTIDYLKERRQFGKIIGSFQGLQHRAADLYGEIEVSKSLSIRALDALDENDFMAPALCSMAKVKSSKVAQLATNEGVQMFGGIGMTDDEEIGFFLKRARVASLLFGGSNYHLNRYAKMSGY